MNKKAIVMAVALIASMGVFAKGHGGHGGPGHHGAPGVGHRAPAPVVVRHHSAPPPAPAHHHHRHHHHDRSFWGRGGSNFWPGFVGGVVGGVLVDAVTPAPVVVGSPAVITTPAPLARTETIWVEGRYEDQVQPNGTVIRVWRPGHYEHRTVYY